MWTAAALLEEQAGAALDEHGHKGLDTGRRELATAVPHHALQHRPVDGCTGIPRLETFHDLGDEPFVDHVIGLD